MATTSTFTIYLGRNEEGQMILDLIKNEAAKRANRLGVRVSVADYVRYCINFTMEAENMKENPIQ